MTNQEISPNMSKKDYVAEQEQQARALFSAILLLVTALFFFALLVPSYRSMRATQERIVLLGVYKASQTMSDGIADVTYAAIARHAANLERAEIALPHIREGAISDVPGLIATLEAIVEREVGGIFLDELYVAPYQERTAVTGEVAFRPIRLAGLAGTTSVSRLLDALRSALHLFEPTRLEMEFAGEGVVAFTIELQRAVIPQ